DVDRVTRAVLYRARGRGQHLGEQLAAEDPGPEVLDAARFEAIVAERVGVEALEQRLERAGPMRGALTRPAHQRPRHQGQLTWPPNWKISRRSPHGVTGDRQREGLAPGVRRSG